MPARPDKPLRPMRRGQDGKGKSGRTIVAIAPAMSRCTLTSAPRVSRAAAKRCRRSDRRALMATAGENTMRPLLALSAAIDQLNEKIGYVCNLLVLAACIVSAGNAMIRYAFGYSSNGWLELQWYMFAILVMFGASYTFKRNEHVRVEDLLSVPVRTRPALARPDRHAVLPDPGLPAAQPICPGRSSIRPTRSARCPAMPAA